MADITFTGDQSRYMLYMMPWVEEPGRRLFSEPNTISPEEMLYWRLTTDTFTTTHRTKGSDGTEVRTAAQDCFLAPAGWEILGSYMDPAVKDGALILKANYGKGMFFLNQILFPETQSEQSERAFAFWKKYIPNLLAYFARFKAGESEKLPPKPARTLPIKRNYKVPIHMHSLDWYGCDAAPGTIYAIMRYMGWDICSLALKDNALYEGKLDTAKYSDDKVLFLDGQEYHPFNWNDKHADKSHNTYHLLAIGIDGDIGGNHGSFQGSFHGSVYHFIHGRLGAVATGGETCQNHYKREDNGSQFGKILSHFTLTPIGILRGFVSVVFRLITHNNTQ
jgi:hypothetical protein